MATVTTPASDTMHQPAAASDGRSRMLTRMRGDLLTTVAAIVGQSQMLCDETTEQDAPQSLLDDLDKTLTAAKSLYLFVESNIDLDWASLGADDFEEQLRRVRHDIGNGLTGVMGNVQLLLLDDSREGFGAMSQRLHEIQSKCKACVATLSRYKQWDADDAVPPPAARTPEDRDAAVFAESIATAVSPSSEPAHVLVVDDKQTNRDQLRTFLERDGHSVATANDGREALDALRSEEFDLVLLDLVMPEMNGYQVLRVAKGDDRLKHTPIIVVSGFCDVDHVVACIEAGAEDQLPKPVDLKLLRARVNTCLEKKRLREREFGQFFTPELARYYVRHPEKLTVGRDAEVSLLFCDIRRFSQISESLEPAETVRWLSDVMNELSECVMRHRGVLVDYIGDELVAMWGAPDEDQTDHAQLACLAAVDMLGALPAINDRWQAAIGYPTDVGIGINTGVARVGNTGSSQKFKYGPLGNTVNLASRVQGATKYLKSKLLVTGATHERLSTGFPARRVCTVRVVNIDAPIALYEIIADPEDAEFKAPYEQALECFENQDCAKAAALLGGLLSSDPPDGPSVVLMSRVASELLKPSAEFDPVWELPGK